MSPLFSDLGHFQRSAWLICLILGGNVHDWVDIKFAAVVTDGLNKSSLSDQKQAKQLAFWMPLINSDVLMSAM